jgi:tRNA A-37 threonylcarbamoyl transferase component Bud32
LENIYYQEKDFYRFLICQHDHLTPAMKDFLQNPDAQLNKYLLFFLKNASREATTVAVVAIGDNKYVLKRYNPKGFWHCAKRMLRPSRALRSWKNSHYLERQGVATAKPVAVLIEKFGFIRGKTYFLMEFVEGLRGWDIFKRDSDYRSAWDKILEQISLLMKKLYAAKVTHDDFQHNNMLFVNESPVLLDLDHMRIHNYNSLWFRHNFRKDIDNFLQVLGEINPEAQRLAAGKLGRQNNCLTVAPKTSGS